jgi:hypothetical protein
MLHERRFRARLRDPQDAPKLTIMLHAMIVSSLKHIDPASISLDIRTIKNHVERSAKIVTLQALECLSVDNCQALIILCFEYLGSGEWNKAFSILASLARTVDFLNLTVEPDDSQPRPLLPPLGILGKAASHAETEERKRVFWVPFLFDRLVSVTCVRQPWHTHH